MSHEKFCETGKTGETGEERKENWRVRYYKYSTANTTTTVLHYPNREYAQSALPLATGAKDGVLFFGFFGFEFLVVPAVE